MIYVAGSWKMEAGSTIRHLIKGNHYKLNEYSRREFNNTVYNNFQLSYFKKLFFGNDVYTHQSSASFKLKFYFCVFRDRIVRA